MRTYKQIYKRIYKTGAALILMLPLMAARAFAQDAGAWRGESSEQFRQGFVAGVASYLRDYGGSMGGVGRRQGYADCLSGETDRSLLDVVEIWMDAHREAKSFAPSVAVTMALNDYCNVYTPGQPRMPQ
jgi:hypothetical protein